MMTRRQRRAAARNRSQAETIIGRYARRWNVESVIAEAVKFLHLNSLTSPSLVKVHFDVVRR